MALSSNDSPLKAALLAMSGGLVAAISGHPVDTIKTRVQTGQSLTVAIRSGALTAGLLSPVLAVPPAWVANFVAYNAALKYTGDQTTKQHAMAGFLSGIAWATCVSPFELIKCIAQQERVSTNVR
jgi:hypothetical protein